MLCLGYLYSESLREFSFWILISVELTISQIKVKGYFS